MERTVLRFAQNIRVYRSHKGMTQEQLVMLILISRQTVSLWEKGVSSLDAYTIVKLANIFGITEYSDVKRKIQSRQINFFLTKP